MYNLVSQSSPLPSPGPAPPSCPPPLYIRLRIKIFRLEKARYVQFDSGRWWFVSPPVPHGDLRRDFTTYNHYVNNGSFFVFSLACVLNDLLTISIAKVNAKGRFYLVLPFVPETGLNANR